MYLSSQVEGSSIKPSKYGGFDSGFSCQLGSVKCNMAANSAHLGWIGCADWLVTQKDTVEI